VTTNEHGDEIEVVAVVTSATGATLVFSRRRIEDRGLRARGEMSFGIEYTFDGGVFGGHRIWEPMEDQRALQRARAHWAGYRTLNDDVARAS
jgi:hypothetical protein